MGQGAVTIIAALISAGAAIAVCIINNTQQNKKILMELEKRDSIQAYRLEQLEKKVDRHNSVIERTYNLEKRSELLDEKLKVANHRIDDLEKKGA